MIAFGNLKNDTCEDKNSEPCSINKLYNLNFSSYHIRVLSSFIDTYPLMMVALFPLVGISLRNNLMALYKLLSGKAGSQKVFALFAACPPLVIAFLTKDVSTITAFTSGYAGLMLMLAIPSWFVLSARWKLIQTRSFEKNIHLSPFGVLTAKLVMFLAFAFMCFNTYLLAFGH